MDLQHGQGGAGVIGDHRARVHEPQISPRETPGHNGVTDQDQIDPGHLPAGQPAHRLIGAAARPQGRLTGQPPIRRQRRQQPRPIAGAIYVRVDQADPPHPGRQLAGPRQGREPGAQRRVVPGIVQGPIPPVDRPLEPGVTVVGGIEQELLVVAADGPKPGLVQQLKTAL